MSSIEDCNDTSTYSLAGTYNLYDSAGMPNVMTVPPGTYSNAGDGFYTSCPVNTYNSNPGGTSSSSCQSCNGKAYTFDYLGYKNYNIIGNTNCEACNSYQTAVKDTLGKNVSCANNDGYYFVYDNTSYTCSSLPAYGVGGPGQAANWLGQGYVAPDYLTCSNGNMNDPYCTNKAGSNSRTKLTKNNDGSFSVSCTAYNDNSHNTFPAIQGITQNY
jgi:hypothetical protein